MKVMAKVSRKKPEMAAASVSQRHGAPRATTSPRPSVLIV
jgi:hypothetical protein